MLSRLDRIIEEVLYCLMILFTSEADCWVLKDFNFGVF